MRYQYDSSFQEFKLAQRTYIRSSLKRRFLFHFSMWGFLLLGILAVLLFSHTTNLFGPITGVIEAGIVGGLIGGGVVCPILRPWQLRRIYRIFNGHMKQPLHVYIEVEGELLLSGIEGRSEGRFQRPAICNTVEDDKMLLLFFNKKRFLYLSKKSVPPEAIEAVRDWLKLPGAPESC